MPRTRRKKGGTNDDGDSDKKVTNPKTSRKHARNKEHSEIDRVTKAVQAIPAHSQRFLLFRPNRRQRALQPQSTPDAVPQHAVLNAVRFTELPLSARTLDGLAAAAFTQLTAIQRLSLPQSLAGRDVLAAAPTGSGKTLSFVVPVLERLWRERWTALDGLGALILAPTRELSMQIFDVLRSVAARHPVSAGLVIGGKDFEGEKDRVGRMNILVGTPGRVLHHMDTVADMDCNTLKVLVLDEADRILDMGFKTTLDAIVHNLPEERQTLLFSATQTKDIKALARLSLKSPEYLSVIGSAGVDGSRKTGDDASKDETEGKDGGEDNNKNKDEPNDEDDSKSPDAEQGDQSKNSDIKIVGLPSGLMQSYAVVKLEDKLSVLWSFIKTHLKSKMIIFLSSGKQVRFVFEAFCKLRPGMSLLHMHGHMKQARRTEVYEAFCRTRSAALFATDVASRGLDFPAVEWVVQVDCPDDVATYVHRVGRTARLSTRGRAMLLLSEGREENFLTNLRDKGIANIELKNINAARLTRIETRMTMLVTNSVELRALAQKAFTFYLRAVWQKADKDVFSVSELDLNGLARSFGLSVTPRVRFKGGGKTGDADADAAKLRTKTIFGYDKRFTRNAKEERDDESGEEPEAKTTGTKRKLHNADGTDSEAEGGGSDNDSDSDGGDILTVRRRFAVGEKVLDDESDAEEDQDAAEEERRRQVERERRKKKKRKLDLFKDTAGANRIVFDEEGKAVPVGEGEDEEQEIEEEHDGIEAYANSVAQRLQQSARDDKARERERVRALHAKKRTKQKELNRVVDAERGAGRGVVVGGGSSSAGESDDDDDDDDKQAGDSDEEEDSDDDVGEQERMALQILGKRATLK